MSVHSHGLDESVLRNSLLRQQQEQQQRRRPSITPQYQRHQYQNQPRSILGALSISLYQSLSFSRSPSFERTRYIASTCTFIAIIYLRTLHCLFFGTGALSCAVLAKCLKHIIRQPRPERPNLDEGVDMDSQPSFTSPSSSSSSSSTSALHTSGVTFESITSASGFVSSNTSSFSDTQSTRAHTKEVDMNSISTISSSSLSLAPTTSLQQEQANSSNELKTKLTSQKIRRQRRRKIYNFRPDYGMPSSHAQLVAFFVCYISLQLVLMEPEGSPGQWFLILLLQLYAWSVVWSRIQVGHHTVSQVLVGAIIGAIYGMVWFAIWIWKVEDMIKHWQWMDRYGVIQVRKMWRQLEMDEAVAVGRAGGRMYLREDHFPQHGHFLRL